MRFLPWLTATLLLGLLAIGPAEAVLTPGDSTRPLPYGGLARQYLLHVPASYDGSTAVPLVLDHHGYCSNAVQQKFISGMVAVSDREGFLLAHPDGIDNAWDAGLCCPGGTPDDVGFIRAVVAAISAEGNIDASRIYATGLSNGGAISQRLACEAADLFAASAPLAFPVPARPLSECRPSRPMPVLTFMGLVDVLVEYNGGLFPSAAETFDYWHDLNNCTGTTPDVLVTQGDSRCETYTQCASGVETGLCSITAETFGGAFFDGHILYLNDDFVLSDLVWSFLSRFRLPDLTAAVRRGPLTGTTRLKVAGTPANTKDVTWQFGVGNGTWWGSDKAERFFTGPATGKKRRRNLVPTTDGAGQLLAVVAEQAGVDPATIAWDGEPKLKGALGKRAKVTGTLRITGATTGTWRVKLAGKLE